VLSRNRPAATGRGTARWCARWWLAGGEVHVYSTTITQRMHRARKAEAGLPEEVARRWGGGVGLGRRHSTAMERARWSPTVEACPCSLEEEGTEQGGGWLRQIKAPSGAIQTETCAVWRLSVAVGGRGVERKEVGEEARCTGACERKSSEMRDGVGRWWGSGERPALRHSGGGRLR
jgi:hypothetical protein